MSLASKLMIRARCGDEKALRLLQSVLERVKIVDLTDEEAHLVSEIVNTDVEERPDSELTSGLWNILYSNQDMGEKLEAVEELLLHGEVPDWLKVWDGEKYTVRLPRDKRCRGTFKRTCNGQ